MPREASGDLAAHIAQDVASIKDINAVLEVFAEFIRSEPCIPAAEHGRVDVRITLAEATARCKQLQKPER